MNARECLEFAGQDKISPEHLYEYFSQHVPRLTVVYQNSEAGKRPLLSKSNYPNGKYVIAFTDIEAARSVKVHYPEYLAIQEESALPFLLKAYRSDADGIIINPGLPSRLFLEKKYLMNLVSAYSVHRLSRSTGAWLLSLNNELLLAPYQPGKFTVVIYTTEKDARYVSAQHGGEVKLYPWDAIFDRVQRLGAPAPLFHSGLPEQMLLSQSQVQAIQMGPKAGFVEPETVKYPFVPVLGQPNTQNHIASEVSSHANHTGTIQSEPQPVKETSILTESTLPKSEITQYMPTVDYPQPIPPPTAPVEEKEEQQVEAEVAVTVGAVKETKVIEEEKAIEEPKIIEEEKAIEEPKIIKEAKVIEEVPAPSPVITPAQLEEKEPSLGSPVPDTHNNKNVPEIKSEPPVEPTPIPEPTPDPTPHTKHVVPGNDSIAPDVKDGLEKLELATISGEGIANGWEVCQILAEIRRIWVITDMDGNMVILAGQDQSPIVDFFTSDVHAKQLIQEARLHNQNLPQMTPRLVSTKKLYRALANRQPIVWINRGTSIAWTSVMGDTIPYILQLIAQNERNQN